MVNITVFLGIKEEPKEKFLTLVSKRVIICFTDLVDMCLL